MTCSTEPVEAIGIPLARDLAQESSRHLLEALVSGQFRFGEHFTREGVQPRFAPITTSRSLSELRFIDARGLE